jgi:hypothetical protein
VTVFAGTQEFVGPFVSQYQPSIRLLHSATSNVSVGIIAPSTFVSEYAVITYNPAKSPQFANVDSATFIHVINAGGFNDVITLMPVFC